MSDRLTSTGSEKSYPWPRLLFPFMLLLASVAMVPMEELHGLGLENVPVGPNEFMLPLRSLFLLLLLAQSGILLQYLLPPKSPEALKAFAGVSGIAVSFVFLQGFMDVMQSPFSNFSGATLILFSWILNIYPKDDRLIWPVASGLVAGVACAISPVCYSGAAALLFYGLSQPGLSLTRKGRNTLVGLMAFLCGLVPALSGTIPIPIYQSRVFDPEFVKGGFTFIFQNTPLWAWVFSLIGLIVAFIQKQTLLLTLVIPFLIFRLFFAGFEPLEYWGIESTLLLPLSWLTAYGLLRVVRGIEQGFRNINPGFAKRIPALACIGLFAGFLFKIAELYSFA